ncbi:MAG: serine protease [Bacteroidetes bacterium 47-18]|nr:MAG: serine protease [Bacteroidetes bacterium 47-18]
MKKILLSLFAFTTLFSARLRADEGMWIPMLIGKNYEEMKKLGIRLTPQDLYNANNSSLKDAIVHFGGGCTGEMISGQGLLITNHHCGYGNIAALSTVENNYLENGFWARSFGQELPAKGLSVKFLVSMEDVTDRVVAASSRGNAEKRKKNLEDILNTIQKEGTEGGKYESRVASYFSGNQYILLKYEVFTDVRLVATPPKSLGKYGGDTDNWMWPRHTADFSVFRVYAGRDNKPAAYSKDNVPYKPKHFLPVNIKGVEEGDFSMVMGYPGRTERFITSYDVDLRISETNPAVVKLRDTRLSIMRKYMRQDPAVNLMLTSKYASISNYWKYFIGQTEQLKRLNVVNEKKRQEREFNQWNNANKKGYGNLINDFANAFADYKPYAKHRVYMNEGFYASPVGVLGAAGVSLHEQLTDKKAKPEEIKATADRIKAYRENMMKSFVGEMEKEIFARMTEAFYKDISKSQQPDVYQTHIFKMFGNEDWAKTFNDYARYVFATSLFFDDVKFNDFIRNPKAEALEADPAFIYAKSFVDNYNKNYAGKISEFNDKNAELSKTYVKALMEKNKGQLMYPDANSTMRITYGKVGGYSPQDAVEYRYYTHMDGLLAKYKPGDYEFDLPQDFLELVKTKDYGRYANSKGELVTCFVTNNDITGGNSGSPMINAEGHLTGLAFDGNWEAMSGDIAFDKQYKRTIAVDIRFVLWLIDKYGGATNLIDEMTVVK